MRLYGALSELAELIIRLASGKTVKVSASEQTAAGETTVTIPNVVDGADEFVMKDTQQSLTKKTLAGSVTTDGNTNKTSDTILTDADITANKIVIPSLTNNNQRPADKVIKGALTWSADGRLIVGTGLGYKVLADQDSSETLFNKTLVNAGISGGTVSGAQIGSVGSPASIDRISKLQINPGIAGTGNNHVAITNASGELVTESALAKVRGGIGADATNITFPASGVLVTEAGSQSLTNKTLTNAKVSGYEDFNHTTTPGSNPTGAVRVYAKSDNKLYTLSPGGIEQAVGSGGSVLLINKATHGFLAADVGCPVYLNASGDYVKAQADTAAKAEVAGLINKIVDTNNFEVCLGGEVSSVGANAVAGGTLTPGEMYFLSPITAGLLVTTEPTVVGQISKPVGIARTASSIDFFNMRGATVGGANVQTQIALAGAALVSQTTNIQNVTAYTAGELTGWVFIDATTDRRFYIKVQFVKDASGAWKCAYQTTGDTPPQGFNVDVIVSGPDAFVQVQMPPVAGFSSANINFALNAPAVGATLPLQVDSANVSFTDIKAASAAGITFKEDGNTTVGSVSDAGAWTLGPSGFTGFHSANGGIKFGEGSGGKIAFNDFVFAPAVNISGTHVRDSNVNVPSGNWIVFIEYFLATSTQSQAGYGVAWGTSSGAVTVQFVHNGSGYQGTPTITISGGKFRLQIAGAAGIPTSGATIFRVYQ